MIMKRSANHGRWKMEVSDPQLKSTLSITAGEKEQKADPGFNWKLDQVLQVTELQ